MEAGRSNWIDAIQFARARRRRTRARTAAGFTPPDHWKWYDLADLDEWEVEPLEPIVEGMYARGNLVLEVAETQTGKSLKGVYEARVLVTGGKLFDRYAVTPVERVLYIVLEDPPAGPMTGCWTWRTSSRPSSGAAASSLSLPATGSTMTRCSYGSRTRSEPRATAIPS